MIIKTILLSLISFSCLAHDVKLSWSPSVSFDVSGYELYYGESSYNYSLIVNVGTNTEYSLSNISYVPIYFNVSAYDSSGRKSDFCNEAVYYGGDSNSVVFIGQYIQYGTNIAYLLNKTIILTEISSPISYFYSSELIITNNPFLGMSPHDSNLYTYLCANIKYGTNIAQLNSTTYNIMCFTNAPLFQFYGGSMVITNKPL